ncbi:hypothetical protein SSX86_021958 [Deinandra increscens subsp. villosa]|uniref:Uncharacterized protein n=1 Tax=Deinandra increscens subsp. villosa TaxID=3103831 RepID=A0AAP0GQI1_9ASTR
MAIHTKFRQFFSLFYKERNPRQPQPQKTPWSHSSSPPPPPPQPQQPIDRDMGAAHAMKRIPRIKFPQRHSKPSGSVTQPQATPAASEVPSTFFSRSATSDKTLGGKASLQPKRTPMTQEEIDAILVSNVLFCFFILYAVRWVLVKLLKLCQDLRFIFFYEQLLYAMRNQNLVHKDMVES